MALPPGEVFYTANNDPVHSTVQMALDANGRAVPMGSPNQVYPPPSSGGSGGGSTPTGSAGSPNAAVVSVQGITNGTALSVVDTAAEAALGTPSDAAYAGGSTMTLSAGIRSLYGLLTGTLKISATALPLPAGAAQDTTVGAVSTATGTQADAAWTTGNGTLVALGKAIVGKLAGVLTVTLNGMLPAGTNLIGTVGNAAGEAHIGEVGGNVGKAQTQFGPASSTTYTAGQAMAAPQRLDGMARVANGTGLISAATLELATANTVQVDLVFFSAAPSGTYTAGTAFTLSTADAIKVSKVIHLTDWTALGASASLGEPNPTPKFFRCDDTTNTMSLWVLPVARGSITLATATDATLTVRSARN